MIGDIDPGVLWELTKSRQRDDLRAAAADRFFAQAHPRGPGLLEQLSLAVGDHLIALGLRLKQRYGQQSSAAHLYGRSSA